MERELEGDLDLVAVIMNEALATCAWRARTASRGSRTSRWSAFAASEGGALLLFLEDRELGAQLTWSYRDVADVTAPAPRIVAYAEAVSDIVARSHGIAPLQDELPSPFLLALPHLVTKEDFDRERRNVELEERAMSFVRSRRH